MAKKRKKEMPDNFEVEKTNIKNNRTTKEKNKA